MVKTRCEQIIDQMLDCLDSINRDLNSDTSTISGETYEEIGKSINAAKEYLAEMTKRRGDVELAKKQLQEKIYRMYEI